MTTTDSLSSTFAALADPTRRAILSRLATGDRTVGELAEPFDMSLPAISKHLRVLEKAGLISRSRDAQRRPCHLEAAPLREVADWAEHYRSRWEQRFDRLGAYLNELRGETAAERSASGAHTTMRGKRRAGRTHARKHRK
ncbi:MAG: metalloregulator ArsR/SmtB family transcription factor [Polyangiaceae bacterium]